MTGPARPRTASVSAAEHLSPAFPSRAAWGTADHLRAWQAAALEAYIKHPEKDFLTVATPGAGKTTFALRIATELMRAHVVSEVTVVCPTEHLKTQWAQAAARVGIKLDPDFANAQGQAGASFNGVCVTYAQVASNPMVHRNRTAYRNTLVILDEIHHGGDALSWGDGIRVAFEPAKRRLALTGTPFRSDDAQIPFVRYIEDETGRRSQADYSYGYADALRDGVVRPVMFLSYSGQMQWQNRQGDVLSGTLGEQMTKDMTAQAWRTALDPHGDWIPAVFTAADERLTTVREGVPDAGGLIIATDHVAAKAYAQVLESVTGEEPVVVLSDDPTASTKISEFAASQQRWMIAVRMVSEGVDVPRLAVGVYATSASTPLYFAQAIGRFVRARKRGETASVFLPSVPKLLTLAAEMERERDHVIARYADGVIADDDVPAEREAYAEAVLEDQPSFQALSANASFDRVLFDGGEFGLQAQVGSDEEADFLGIPGLLEPEQVTMLLREHQAKQNQRVREQAPPPRGEDEITRRRTARKELQGLVSAWASQTGTPHAIVHSRLREACGGPAVALASADQIEERIAQVRRWFVGKR